MESHIILASNLLPSAVPHQIASAGVLDEISNSSGALHYHIYWHRNCKNTDNTLLKPMLYAIFHLSNPTPWHNRFDCISFKRFYIASNTKVEDDGDEDDINRLEKEIIQGHMGVIFIEPEPNECEED